MTANAKGDVGLDVTEALVPTSVEPAWTTAQYTEAEAAEETITDLLRAINKNEQVLSRDITKLGLTLLSVQSKQFWLMWGFRSWSSYLESLAATHGRKRTQLYHVVGVVADLEESLGAECLNRIGISKAIKLRMLKKAKGSLPEAIIRLADNPSSTIQDVEVAVLDAMGAARPEHGKYRNLGSSPWTDEEWKEYTQAIAIAKREAGIPHDAPEDVQMKMALLAMAREFLSTYGAV